MEQPYFYGNQGYNFDRLPRKLITINITNTELANTSNIYQLLEPITIDKISDVYIDSFISNNLVNTAEDTEIFILGIKEFNIQSVSNDTKYQNKLIIPNTTGTANANNTVAHRSTKFNFIGTVNPTKLSSLEILLTKSDDTAISGSGSVWVTFMFIARD